MFARSDQKLQLHLLITFSTWQGLFQELTTASKRVDLAKRELEEADVEDKDTCQKMLELQCKKENAVKAKLTAAREMKVEISGGEVCCDFLIARSACKV
eukprot:COSAG01_NODE_18993_length_1038_cov_3.665602_1_plen_99_part_00